MREIAFTALALCVWGIPFHQSSRQPSPGVTKKESGSSTQLSADARDKQQAAETAAINAIIAAVTEENQERAAERQQETAIEKDSAKAERENVRAEWGLFWVGIAQTIALIGTLLAVWYQAKKTAEAARATKISAQAALSNAQAVINAERAWIVVDVESSEPNKFNFRATNVGKTPAKIKSIWSHPITFWRDSKLEIPPDEKTGESLLSTPPCLLPPTASQIVLRCNTGELGTGQYIGPDAPARVQNDIQKGFRMLYFYGRIIYSDTLDEKSLHETKWLYWYLPVGEGVVIPDPQHPEWNSYS